MSTFTQTLGRTDFATRRPLWVRVLNFLVAHDALHRERHDLASLNEHILRDIGVSRADVAATLRRPDEHYRLILGRCGDKLQY